MVLEKDAPSSEGRVECVLNEAVKTPQALVGVKTNKVEITVGDVSGADATKETKSKRDEIEGRSYH